MRLLAQPTGARRAIDLLASMVSIVFVLSLTSSPATRRGLRSMCSRMGKAARLRWPSSRVSYFSTKTSPPSTSTL
jgi:hypothetical protein